MSLFYKIKSPFAEYNSVVKLSKTGKKEIILGGSKKYCVSISAPNNDLNLRNDAECYINRHFPNKLTDAKDMIKASIFILKEINGDICEIEFDDMSEKNGVSLSSVMLVFYQMTWYEKYFNAKLKEVSLQELYKKNIKQFLNPDHKQNMSSESFKRFLIDNNGIEIETLMEVYDKTRTYKEFFDILRKEIESSKLYVIIRPWLSPFINNYMNLGFVRQKKWIINCKDINTSNFNKVELNYDPYNGKYLFISQKGGSKTLSKIEKNDFRNPRWIGWNSINDVSILEYNYKDQIFLKKLSRNFSSIV